MMTEEWLCSTLRLCQLTTDSDSAPPNDWNAEEVVINTHTYPKCDYDYSSIFITLNAYTDTLYEAWSRNTNLNKQHRSQDNSEIVDRYAETLCADIVDMALRGRVTTSTDDGTVRHPENTDNGQAEVIELTVSCQERQAERLASEIYSRALEELGVLSSVPLPKQMDQTDSISEVHSEPAPFLGSPTRQPSKTTGDCDRTHSQDRPDYDPGSRDRASGSATCCGMLNAITPTGSLDYPDAPPSTPLLPGMMKSRDSFTRKLKGGLAKAFMPSTPPPTPKDQQVGSLQGDRMAGDTTGGSEFMIRLVRSLSLACAQCGDLDEEERGGKDRGRVEAAVTALSEHADGPSAGISHSITSTQTCVSIKEEPPVRDVLSLADHLAEEIVLMSIAEMVWWTGLGGKTQQKSPSLPETETQDRTQVFSKALMPRSGPDVPAMEILRALSDKLVANALVHAFSELGVDGLLHSSGLLGAGPESMRSGAGSDHCSNSCLDTTTCHQITAPNLGTSEPDCSTGDIRAATLTPERSFAETIVDEALRLSMEEHCKCRLSNRSSSDHLRLSSSVLSPRTAGNAVVKGVVSETQCRDLQDLQDLQCILLWAAASRLGTSVLRLQLPEGHVQQQLCSLSLRTQFRGWTVGDLMGFVLQYCEDLQATSRGRCMSSDSLLGHLLLCVD
ncbi:uncharacterized protein LOC143488553 [Brachyhypopomus gauderio]|uniref:uncharacterized protein LOC143488553 n=1 Tax=Brachyhypopomus gauderio TaxID=698409 RepID=UPI004042E3C6